MIFSSNQDSNTYLFNEILSLSIQILNAQASATPELMKSLAGTKLEEYVKEIMAKEAIGTEFEDTIECLGGISFPDIIANNYFGVEVKTTVKDHWKTTGNSVLEKTRKKDIEKIYLLFGKLGDPIEFRFRPYEECLAEVVVTHSPRYLIDMNLGLNKTIFDRIDIPYDVLRKSENPIRPILQYYKSQLKEGEELWWIDPNDSEPMNMVIKLWNNLGAAEKEELHTYSFSYFPEIMGKQPSKYNKLAIWLSTSKGVVCPNVRDNFSAGGRCAITANGRVYKDVPQIFSRLYKKRQAVKNSIQKSDISLLSKHWNVKAFKTDRFKKWLTLANVYSRQLLDRDDSNLVNDIFQDVE